MTDDTVQRLEGLYQEIGPALWAYFCRRHGNEAVADDLVQDTFAEALKQPGRWRQALSPKAYLFGIARNLSRGVYRKERFWRLFTGRTFFESEGPMAATAAAPAVDERLERMREAMSSLPDLLREVLELRLQQDLSYEEIAGVLRIPVGTVRSRLHHAVAQLRQRMISPIPPSP